MRSADIFVNNAGTSLRTGALTKTKFFKVRSSTEGILTQ